MVEPDWGKIKGENMMRKKEGTYTRSEMNNTESTFPLLGPAPPILRSKNTFSF
jgi:hypothetical protein